MESRNSKKTQKFHPYERKKSSSANSDDATGTESDDMKEVKRSVGTRETHNKLEKNRRAHLRECFEALRLELPNAEERRTSNLATLRSSLRLIEQLVGQQKELESEKRKQQKTRSSRQAKLTALKKELKEKNIEYNLEDWIAKKEDETNSTSTASECVENMNLPPDIPVPVQVAKNPDVTIAVAAEKKASTEPAAVPKIAIPAVASPVVKQIPAEVAQDSAPKAIQMIQQAAVRASLQRQLILKTESGQSIPVTPVAQPTQQVLQMAQVQALPKNAVLRPKVPTANIISSPAAPVQQQQPMTISLQTGKFFNPRRPFPKSASVDLSYNGDGALNIAPKGLVLITTDQNKIQRIATAVPHTTTTPAVSTPAATTAAAPAPAAPSVQAFQPTIQVTNPLTSQQLQTIMGSVQQQISTMQQGATPQSSSGAGAIDIIPLSSLATTTTTTTTPTLITGMIPTTAADGTVSFVPVTLTTRPVAPASTQNFLIPTQDVSQMQSSGQSFAVVLGSIATTSTVNAAQLPLPATSVSK